MATEYFLTLESSTNKAETVIVIIKDLIPFPIKFSFRGNEDEIGNANGKAAEGVNSITLHTGPGGAGVIILEGFTSNTKKGDSGSGNKQNFIGSFPDEDFVWQCDKVD